MSPFQLATALTPYATQDNGFGGKAAVPSVAKVQAALVANRRPGDADLKACLKYLDRLGERAASSSPLAQAHLALVLRALQKL